MNNESVNNENKIKVNNITYVAKDSNMDCDGCAARYDVGLCSAFKNCCSTERKDKRNVIFVKEENESTR